MHIPVLQKEVIQYLSPKPNENFIDCTIGEAGHTLAILEKTAPKGKILGIDADPEQIENCKLKIGNLKKRITLVCDNYANLREIVKKYKFRPIQGILFDLGMSSWHLEQSKRGFSFQRNEPLDMRYNPENPLTAEKIVNLWSKSEIEKILREYGEERFAERIAQEIINQRKIKPIKRTFQLVEIIKKATPRWYQHPRTRTSSVWRRGRISPATRTFQALRIAVNAELENLKKVLPQTLEVLKPGGRLVIISFHSLEDRIVKNFFKEEKNLKILTKKPLGPTLSEIKINPRSRSAKLRACSKHLTSNI